MARNMSFALTIEQFKARTQTVTHRLGWWFLKPGDIVCGVKKTMSLKRGEKLKPLGMIRIISRRQEPLDTITQEDVVAEGFPNLTPSEFVSMLVAHCSVTPARIFNRIEFEYLENDIGGIDGSNL